MSAEPSRCTMQRHKQLTLQRCKTNIASNAKHPFSKIVNTGTGVPATRLGATPQTPFYKNISFFDRNKTTILFAESWFYCYYIISGLYNVIVRRILHIAVYQVL